MSNSQYLPDNINLQNKVMIFIDGENLAIRFKELLGESSNEPHVTYLKDTFVWSKYANIPHHTKCEIIRKYYYTSVQGDEDKLNDVVEQIKKVGIETPRVFKKKPGLKSKRVDITLAVDLLTHAHHRNFDIAILVAGDDDYVPLVRALKQEGRRVVLWFFEDSNGLSKTLKQESDYFFDISWFLLKPESEIRKFYIA